jgi:hypothetical protein
LINRWANWVYATPIANNAAIDYQGANTQIQPAVAAGLPGANVFFLAGSFGGSVTRACTVPANKNLFFPIIAASYSNAEFPNRFIDDTSDLMSLAKADIDTVRGLALILDGSVLYDHDLKYYRAQASFTLTFGANPVRGIIPTGTNTPAVADGYWIGIRPLTPVGNHLIHFFATSENGYTQDVTYNLNVQ